MCEEVHFSRTPPHHQRAKVAKDSRGTGASNSSEFHSSHLTETGVSWCKVSKASGRVPQIVKEAQMTSYLVTASG